MSSLSGRGDLTDKQWERLRRWIPAPARAGRPITRSRRTLFNGVAWRVRVGAPWRDVPEVYGPWPTVYRLFATWQQRGIWTLMVKLILALLDAAHRLDWTLSVDSTTVRPIRPQPGPDTGPSPVNPPTTRSVARGAAGPPRSISPPTPPKRSWRSS